MSNANTTEMTAAEKEAAFLTQREKELRKQYSRIVEGSIRREEDGHHKGKLTVEIRCATKGCPNKRRVATSDLFQVKHCEECTANRRAERRRKKAKESRALKSGKKAVKKTRKAKPTVAAEPALVTA